MLYNVKQFINKNTIKSYVYLLSPIVHEQSNISLPRFSIYHYLEYENDVLFPYRELYIFNNVPKNKRIPIHHVTDLDYQDGISSIQNKRLPLLIKKWHTEHIKEFKRQSLELVITKDANLIGIVNYNPTKEVYRYKSSILMEFYKFTNTFKTVTDTIKKLYSIDRENTHFLRVNIPELLPSYSIVHKFTTFSDVKYSKIVHDSDLKVITEIYKWLSSETRDKSVLSSLTDEESNNLYLELQYKGYVSYIRLGLLRELSKESKLEAKQKIDPKKVPKLFCLVLYKVQKTVEQILAGELQQTTIDIHEEHEEYDENKEEGEEVNPENKIISNIDLYRKQVHNKDEDVGLKEFSENLLTSLDRELLELEELSKSSDEIYGQDIIHIDSLKDEELEFNLNVQEDTIQNLTKDLTLQDRYTEYTEEAKSLKNISTVELKNNEKLMEKRQLLKSAYDKSTPIDKYTIVTSEEKEITPQEKSLPVKAPTITEDAAQESVRIYDKKYITKTLKKDIVSSIKHVENAGVILSNHEVQEVKDAMGNYEIHRVTLKPLDGKENTLTFKLPMIDEEGEFYATGIKGRLRKVRTDIPIRKISPTTVALTSSYGKLFIGRSEKVAYDGYGYIVNYIKKNYIGDNPLVVDIKPGNVYDNHKRKPNIISRLSMDFKEFKTREYTITLDEELLQSYFKLEDINSSIEKGLYPCGYRNSDKAMLVCNSSDVIMASGDYIGTIDTILSIDPDRIPKNFTNIKILGDDIPLGVVLSYYMGLDKLLAYLKADVEIHEASDRIKGSNKDIVLKFSDKKLLIKNPSQSLSILINGFNYYRDFIKQCELDEFTLKSVYLNMLEFRGHTLKHLNELDLLRSLFIDPITRDVLQDINEPTEFIPLLFRANELLQDLSHPDINDPSYARIRGYERIPSMIYKTLAESVRSYKLRFNKSNKIELDPYKVWNTITMDNSKKLSEDVNPILDLKESEIVTLTGADALSKGAIPKFLRRYHKNDMGLISEATVDSSDVAVNSYLTPYAKLKNTRGLVDIKDEEYKKDPAKILSTSSLLAPMVEYDDPKRINFINIQNGHTIFSHGYKQPILRTGYEYVMPYRVGSLYCTIAKEDGIVLDVTNRKLTVKYASGKIEGIELGSKYGQMEGTLYPHEIVTKLTKGQKFKQNDYLAYNENFFEPDWLDKSRLIMKFSRNVTIALSMTNDVFEDSSSISEELSKTMTTEVIKDKTFIIDFKSNIIGLKPPGTKVEPNDTLFTVVDQTTDYTNLSQSTIEMLESLAQLSPKAKVQGIIDSYDIKYNGDIADMSDTLRKLCSKKDDEVRHLSKHTFYEIENNRVTSDYRIGNVNLNVDKLALTVYIRIKVNQSVGDKGVFANQMKSVISDVFTDKVTTDSGEKVDAFFSYKGILNRIVLSPILIGTTNRLLKHVSKNVSQLYF